MEFVVLFVPLLLVLVVPQIVGRALGRRGGDMTGVRASILSALPSLAPFALVAALVAASDMPVDLSACSPPLCSANTAWWELLLLLAIPCFVIALLLGRLGYRAGRKERDRGIIKGR